jgi:hypothetical protein
MTDLFDPNELLDEEWWETMPSVPEDPEYQDEVVAYVLAASTDFDEDVPF